MGDLLALAILLIAVGLLLAALIWRERERRAVILSEWEWGLLYIDGRFQRALEPGRYHLWPYQRRRTIHRIARNPQVHSGALLEVMSQDRFVFRLSVACAYRITDPRAAFENPLAMRLTLAVGEAAAEFVAARTLEVALAERAELGSFVAGRVQARLSDIEVGSAQVTALALPPEMRRMFTEVERAKHEAQATLERARGEQAALRSLANAARMLKGNPELMRLRTLQALSPTGKGATLVLGHDAILAPNPATPTGD